MKISPVGYPFSRLVKGKLLGNLLLWYSAHDSSHDSSHDQVADFAVCRHNYVEMQLFSWGRRLDEKDDLPNSHRIRDKIQFLLEVFPLEGLSLKWINLPEPASVLEVVFEYVYPKRYRHLGDKRPLTQSRTVSKKIRSLQLCAFASLACDTVFPRFVALE